jgi:GrpB-like predicted nucleotidyltransferase (UPF0157 family)/GNAT superfamily N-acetyltransferase
MSTPVVIADYDPTWPERFRQEKRVIEQAAGARLGPIEHVGSTAVPGLAAKPVVDIMAGARDRASADGCLAPLAEAGYTDVTLCDEHPGWFYCIGKGRKPHDAHLHLADPSSGFWERHLLFREYLRADSGSVQEYARLKRRLALRYQDNRLGYCNAKTRFIRSVEVRARGIEIRRMMAGDIDRLFKTFSRWDKTLDQFRKYFTRQQEGKRVAHVAAHRTVVVGYGCLTWKSLYEPFQVQGIPEIVDLNVINEWQRKGIATALVYQSEKLAADHGHRRVGISVVQTEPYKPADRLYRTLGYEPDGRGITDKDNELHLVAELDPD